MLARSDLNKDGYQILLIGGPKKILRQDAEMEGQESVLWADEKLTLSI